MSDHLERLLRTKVVNAKDELFAESLLTSYFVGTVSDKQQMHIDRLIKEFIQLPWKDPMPYGYVGVYRRLRETSKPDGH